jgi:hypothetical protein
MRHPEQHDDEIYLGNTTERDLWRSDWNSSRMGEASKSPFGDLRPWFIARSEVEGKIRSISADAPNYDERVRTYQSMLDDGAA